MLESQQWPLELNTVTDGSPACVICKHPLLLAAQMYCPVGSTPDHRILYIFCCGNASCASDCRSWRAFRVQCPATGSTIALADKSWSIGGSNSSNSKACEQSKAYVKSRDCWFEQEDDWADESSCAATGAAVEDWSCPSVTASSLDAGCPGDWHSPDSLIVEDNGDVESLADRFIHSKISDTGSDTREGKFSTGCSGDLDDRVDKTKAPEGFEPYYVAVVEEEQVCGFSQCVNDSTVERLLKDYQRHGGNLPTGDIGCGDSASSGSSADTYEKGNLKHGDWHFHHFLKVLNKCPEQLIRYSYRGKPILARPQVPLLPACGYCGVQRSYELQLMPALGRALVRSDSGQRSVEVCTVLVFTCDANCWPSAKEASPLCREEAVIVQYEPDYERLTELEKRTGPKLLSSLASTASACEM